MKSRIRRIVEQWAKEHTWNYNCYKHQIEELIDKLEKNDN